jgi:hypothetical protein
VLSPLHPLGAWAPVALVALLVCALYHLAGRLPRPSYLRDLERRYRAARELRDALRRQAVRERADRDKIARLTGRLETAALDAARRDYRFHALLFALVIRVPPVVLGLVYLAESYGPAQLQAHFDRGHVLAVPWFGGEPWRLGAVALYGILVALGIVLLQLVARHRGRGIDV